MVGRGSRGLVASGIIALTSGKRRATPYANIAVGHEFSTSARGALSDRRGIAYGTYLNPGAMDAVAFEALRPSVTMGAHDGPLTIFPTVRVISIAIGNGATMLAGGLGNLGR